ncbi:MAG: phosphomannomutase/phosphoglucomutase [Patescibacteria group bacterium]
MPSISEKIFKSYDIRGLVEGELSEDVAYRVGRAFVRLLREEGVDLSEKYVVVGRDMRPTSSAFQHAVTRGICDEGGLVMDIGLASTPLFNFACTQYPNHTGGIMVPASHNPAEYNGFKLTRANGLPVGKGSGMENIRDFVLSGGRRTTDDGQRTMTLDVLPGYLDKIFFLVPEENIRPLRCVIDYGNGMGSVTFKKLLERLPITVTSLYEEPDGSFPNHEANPLKTETLRDLQKKVRDEHADFGFALDGDADRIGLVDEQGDVVDASYVGALIGLEVLRAHPQARMLYDLRQSMIVPDVWRAAGASQVEKTMVGHANIKRVMKEKQAVFASELSLHLYYHDLSDVESSDLSFLYIAQMLSRAQRPLSEIIAPLKKYFHSGEINFEVADKEAVMKKIEDTYASDAEEISHLDGVWMKFPWGWVSVRASNTDPVLRLNVEAVAKDVMEEKMREVSEMIEG